MKKSAGILLYRRINSETEVLLVHPGGPFWSKKHEHTWSIPKGEPDEGEDLLEAAKREFFEETGSRVDGDLVKMMPVKQSRDKTVYAWLCEGDMDETKILSNTFEMEWPPRSGKKQSFPEVDMAGWFNLQEAREKIVKGQVSLIDQLEKNILASNE